MEYEDLEFGAPLGEGSFSFVFKGSILSKHTVVAVKKLKAPKNITELSIFDEFTREIWIMRLGNILFNPIPRTKYLLHSGLSHPNLVKFHGFTIDPCCIVVEFVGGGDLFSFVLKVKKSFTLCFI